MLTHWNKTLNTDCKVIEIKNHCVYPIYRNGSSSLYKVAETTFTNNQISKCKLIHILLRDPEYRFTSGLNEYCRQNNLNVKQGYELVANGELIDRHFVPQWLWLLHLYKYYKGNVLLLPFENIKSYCDIHIHPTQKNESIPLLNNFIDIDKQLMKHIGEEISLEILIKKYKNVLS